MFYVIAAISCLVCMSSIGFVLYHKAVTGLAIPGWTSIITTASFFGALNALGISVLGEYVIRIYDQVRSRPIYVTEQTRNFDRQNSADSDPGTASIDNVLQEVSAEFSRNPQSTISS